MKSNLTLRLLPRIQDIFFISIFIAVLLLGQRMLNLDGDLPRHLLTGKYILETRSFPTTEPFIHPYFKQPYVPHEWLTDVIFYIIHTYAGLAGIVALAALINKAKPSNSNIYDCSLGSNCNIPKLGGTPTFGFHVFTGNMACLDR
jgi:hypothetical protein